MSNDISIPNDSLNSKKKKMDVFEGRDPEVKVRTKKMMMYLIIFAIVMIFAGFFSAYIVSYNSSKFWIHVPAPTALWVSNVLLVFSSIAAIMAHRSAKGMNRKSTLIWLVVTFLIGISFVGTQSLGFLDMASRKVVLAGTSLASVEGEYGKDFFLTSGGLPLIYDHGDYFMPDDKLMAKAVTDEVQASRNHGASYIQLLIILHVLHVVFALIYLIVNVIRTVRGFFDNKSNVISLYAQGLYWHFMGILWLLLFVFLFFFH